MGNALHRHSDPVRRLRESSDHAATPPANPDRDHQARLRLEMEDSLVHQPLRVPPFSRGAERGESRTVADQRGRASMGEPVAVDSLVEVFGDRRITDQSARDGLECLDYALVLRRLIPRSVKVW